MSTKVEYVDVSDDEITPKDDAAVEYFRVNVDNLLLKREVDTLKKDLKQEISKRKEVLSWLGGPVN